ncbi:MAG: TMAO reductase system periplasmic protein TorT [SAR324 cluster bacterium]|nr:TMAO reductase system periplasmic protein TorT [SAR324 cluster bacterium]
MKKRMFVLTTILLLITCCSLSTFAAKAWYPINVDVWDPPFNTERKRVQKSYVPLEKAAKPWKICVSIPHLKDAYWLAVNYGLVDEARRMGVSLDIYEAGGYDRLDVQRKQIEECVTEKPDGLIISAISAEGLNDLVEQYQKASLPVLDLINGMSSTKTAAKTAVDFWDTGNQVGHYLRKLNPGAKGEVQVAWFPGPEGAAWVAQGDSGFNEALAGTHLKIISTLKGDTGKTTQAKLIESMLDGLGGSLAEKLDYIVGTTVSAEAAVEILRGRKLQKQVKVLSYYYGPGVHRGIRRGSIVAAPTDSQAIQARMAVDTIVRILEGKPYFEHAAPQVIVVDRNNLKSWDSSTTLAPKGFRPIFSVGK